MKNLYDQNDCLSYKILKTLVNLGIQIDDFDDAQEKIEKVIDEHGGSK